MATLTDNLNGPISVVRGFAERQLTLYTVP
jgi:hypothetical protein